MSKRRIEEVNGNLNCEWCNKEQTGSLFTLPCGFRVCESHLDTKSELIVCFICQNHEIYIKECLDMPANKIKIQKIDLENRKIELETNIQELKQIKNDPSSLLDEVYSSLIQKIDLRREELKLQIDEHSQKLINQVREDQAINQKKFNEKIQSIDIKEIIFEKDKIDSNSTNNSLLIQESLVKIKKLIDKIKKLTKASLRNIEFPINQVDIASIFGSPILNSPDIDSISCKIFLEGHMNSIEQIRVLKSGNVLTYAKDKSVKIWNKSTGHCVKSLRNYGKSLINCLKVSNEGNIITTSWERSFKAWNPDTFECIQVFLGHTRTMWCFDLTQDGRIVTASSDKTIRIWNEQTGECLKIIQCLQKDVACLRVLNEEKLAVGYRDGSIEIMNLADGKDAKILFEHFTPIVYIDLLEENFISVSKDCMVSIWDLNGVRIKKFNFYTDILNAAKLFDKTNLVTCCEDKKTRIWDLNTGNCVKILSEISDKALEITDSREILVGCEDNIVRIFSF